MVGGGNSAGQAAVHLGRSRRHVYMVVRGEGLTESMSRYLVQRIEKTSNIKVLPDSELVGHPGAGPSRR